MSFTNPMTNEIIIKHLIAIDKKLNEMNIKIEEIMKNIRNKDNSNIMCDTTTIENSEYRREDYDDKNEEDSGWMKVNRRYKKEYKKI